MSVQCISIAWVLSQLVHERADEPLTKSISLCQRPMLNPCQTSTIFLGDFLSGCSHTNSLSCCSLRQSQQGSDMARSSVPRSSESPRTTLLLDVEMFEPRLVFSGIIEFNAQPGRRLADSLTDLGEFSPIPTVNTRPSIPPSTAVKAPISFAAR